MAEHTADQAAKTIAAKVDNIPSLPQVVARVVSLVNRADTSADDLARAVKTDPALTADLLRFANARYYGHSGEINSIKRAITILGFNTVRSIVLSHGIEKTYTAPECPQFPRQKFWNYSLACGVASEIIARRLGYGGELKDQAFSAGHLHAIGKVILDQYIHREFIKILQTVTVEKITMYEAEKKIMGFTHCQIGAEVLAKWNLPTILIEAARYYYEPAKSDEEIVTIVHLGSILTKTKNYGSSGDDSIDYLDEAKVDELNLPDDAIEVILKNELPREYSKLLEI